MSSAALRQPEQVLSATMMFVSPKSRRLVRSARWRAFRENQSTFAEMLDVLPLIAHMSEIEGRCRSPAHESGAPLARSSSGYHARHLTGTPNVSCVSVEVRCERARADRPADQLEQKQSRRYARLTLTSIIVTALAAVATGGLTLTGSATADGIAGVTGGAMGGLFGGLALWDVSAHEFQHPRNHLREIWEGPKESEVFPRSVWRF